MITSLIKQLFNNLKKDRFIIVLNALKLFIPIFLIILILTIIMLKGQEKMEMDLYKNSEKIITDNKLKNIEFEINQVLKNLFTLKSDHHIQEFLEDENDDDVYQELAHDMLHTLQFQKSYDQIRLIDEIGMEIIRINYNNGKARIVPKEELQNKKNRYYFSEAIKLNENEVFISPLDLNIENNIIEQPLKPMIRIGTPYFNKAGKKRGILLFNFLGDNILNPMKSFQNSIIDNQLYILNKEGYWLKGPVKENEWGFMYDNKKDINFSNLYPNEWSWVKNNESFQFENKIGLYTVKTIYPLIEALKLNNSFDKIIIPNETQLLSKNYFWKIVSFIPSKKLYFKQNERRLYISFILAVIALSLFLVSLKLAKVQVSRKKTLQLLKINNETKDKFFSIVAHDLKSPFNALLGFSNLLLDEIKDQKSQNIEKYSTIINTTLNNTYNFLTNLLEWSRLQTNKIELIPEYFYLHELVNDIFDVLYLQANNKDISMQNSVPENLKIIADKNILSIVIRNLVSNALKYNFHGGKIIVSASIINHRLHCTISDNGIGISKNAINKLFELASTSSTPGTDNEKGTGLGLILCKDFIEKHNGKISVESEIGVGSDFWFEIPQFLIQNEPKKFYK